MSDLSALVVPNVPGEPTIVFTFTAEVAAAYRRSRSRLADLASTDTEGAEK